MLKKNEISQQNLRKNRTKPWNPYYLVLIENRTKPETVLSETVLSEDSLYIYLMRLKEFQIDNCIRLN